MSQYFAQWRDGYQVVWRDLTWSEYKLFKLRYDQSPFLHPMDLSMDMYRTLLVKGPDPKVVPSGIPAYICNQQMKGNPFSGDFRDISNALALSRQAVQSNFLISAKGMIASILHYRVEEMDNWDPTTFFIRLAQAELASGRNFQPLDPRTVEPTDPNYRPKKQYTLNSAQQKALDRVKNRDNK